MRPSPTRSAATEPQIRAALRASIERLYPFAAVQLADVEGVKQDRLVMRVTARCNQRCPFCQAELSTSEPDPPLDGLVRAAERMAAALPRCQVILTGGEPTLRPDVAELCQRIACISAIDLVEVQTNAVPIGRHPDQFAWPSTNKLRFLVALHGFEGDVYDACTGTKGMLPDALAGLRHLLAKDHAVELNHVVTSLNVHALTKSVEQLAHLFPKPPRPRLHFSVMGIPEHREVTNLHVSYDVLVRSLEAALERATELDVPHAVALSASHARVPNCVMARSDRFARTPMPTHEHDPDGTLTERWWMKPAACERCRDRDVCLGLPRSYVEKFEAVELHPLNDDSEP